jgi:hypothetical protein
VRGGVWNGTKTGAEAGVVGCCVGGADLVRGGPSSGATPPPPLTPPPLPTAAGVEGPVELVGADTAVGLEKEREKVGWSKSNFT